MNISPISMLLASCCLRRVTVRQRALRTVMSPWLAPEEPAVHRSSRCRYICTSLIPVAFDQSPRGRAFSVIPAATTAAEPTESAPSKPAASETATIAIASTAAIVVTAPSAAEKSATLTVVAAPAAPSLSHAVTHPLLEELAHLIRGRPLLIRLV
jgi:hypothetical protein